MLLAVFSDNSILFTVFQSGICELVSRDSRLLQPLIGIELGLEFQYHNMFTKTDSSQFAIEGINILSASQSLCMIQSFLNEWLT